MKARRWRWNACTRRMSGVLWDRGRVFPCFGSLWFLGRQLGHQAPANDASVRRYVVQGWRP